MSGKWVPPSVLVAVLLVVLLPATGLGQQPTGPAGVEAALLDALSQPDATADFFVFMGAQADLAPASALRDWQARGRAVYDSLLQAAEQSQAPVVVYAEEHGLAHRSFLTNNAVYIEGGDLEAVKDLALLPGVAWIRQPEVAQIQPGLETVQADPDAYNWNLDTLDPGSGLYGMQAAQVWQQYGVTGEGIVVANIDTGVYYQHVSLDRQYRGNTTGNIGGPYDHDYNWYQPNFMPCGNGTYPCDSDVHGSGTMGIMIGETPDQLKQIGIAPDARWIACQGCDDPPYCTEVALAGCADWMLAPCPIGVDPGDPACDPDLRPHVVNNSWGGSGCRTWYQPYVQAWVAAGIFPAFAAGNAGGCGTVASPGDLPESFGTAAHFTDGNNAYAGGPSCFYPTPTCDPEAHDIDPHLNAPTGGETASGEQAQYYALGGTSGASPHTAGAVALVWSANPGLIGQIDATFTILEQSANRDFPAPLCGKPACAGSNSYPNYDLGWGYLDALAAVHMAGAGALGALDGTVTDASPPNDPLPDVTIRAQGQTTDYAYSVQTDASGYYTQTLPAGTYTVTADGPLHGPATVAGVTVFTDAVTTLDFQLLLKGRLYGYVTDADTGEPLAATVRTPDVEPVETDPASGYYSIRLGEGSHDVIVEANNYASVTQTLSILSGEELLQDFSLVAALALAPRPIHAVVELSGTLDVTTVITNRTPAAYEFSLSHDAAQAGGEGPILLVDDENLEENPVAFEVALENLGYDYVRVDAAGFLNITVPELFDYAAVIYAGTADLGPEHDHIIAYLDAGGRFLLADGSFTLYHQDSRLHRLYLQAYFDGLEEWAGPQIGLDIMAGLTPDISSMIVVYDSFAGPEGVGIFQAPGGHFSGIRTERAGYRAIYLSFDLNRIGAREPGDADETAVVYPAMLWLLGYPVTAPWYATDVSGGTIPAGSSLAILSQFDATPAAGIEQPGDFYAELHVRPAAAGEIYPRLDVPVHMTVVPRPTMGQVAGTVTNDRPGGPMQAGIFIEPSSGGPGWTLGSDWWTGGYGYWLEAGDYTLTVSAGGYYTETAQVTVVAGVTVTQDFFMTLAAPEMSLTPLALEEVLPFGATTTRTLHIANSGPEALVFEVNERDRGATPLPASTEDVHPQGVNGARILFDDYHGSNPTYYDDLFADLQSLGATIDLWSTGPITSTALVGYDILFLGDFSDVPYRFDELDAIDAFVRQGGGLFVSYECCDDATAPAVTGMFDIIFQGRGGTSGVTHNIYPHPTTQGVGSVDLPSRQYLMTVTLTGTAEVVVYDLGGEPAAAVNEVGSGKVFVIADQSFWDGVYFQADNTRFGRNTFGWLYGDVPWMATEPVSATVEPGGALTLTVTFDASAVDEPAIYHGDLVIPNNDPFSPSPAVPVTLTVEPTADLGRLRGTVTSDRPGGPLAAELLVEGGGGAPLTLYSHPATGEYDRWLPAGAYTVTASAAGYLTETASIDVPVGGTVLLDFELVLDAPGVAAQPPAVEETVVWGMTATQRLTVANDGLRDLDFALLEEDLGWQPSAQGTQAYGFDYENDAFVSFSLDAPGDWNIIKTWTYQHFEGGDFRLNDYSQLYVIWGNYLATLDTATGDYDLVADIPISYPHEMTGMTIDAAGTLFVVTYVYDLINPIESYLWIVDPDHGTPTQIGQITNAELASDCAISPDGEMYCVDSEQDVLLHVDPVTGAGVLVGPLGFDLWNGSLDFDDDTGVLYLAAYEYLPGQGHLWVVDIATGATTLVGYFPPGAALAFLAIAADGLVDIPWLAETPTVGTVPPGDDLGIDLTFDASGVGGPGTYRGNLHVQSNDPLLPDLPVPITMTVLASGDLGEVAGTISGTGYCDAELYPLEALVVLEAAGGVTYSVTSDPADGAYSRWVPAGTYTATVSAPLHLTGTDTVQVLAMQTVIHDASLRLFEPCLAIEPTTIGLTLSVGSRLTQTLTVANSGACDLLWALRETTDTLRVPALPPLGRFEGEVPADDAPLSVEPLRAPAPGAPQPAADPDAGLLIGEPAYGLDTSTFNLVHIPDTQDPGTWNVLANVGPFPSGGDFWHGDFSKLYALDFYTNEFVTLDMSTGARTVIGTAHTLPGHHWTGMTIATDGTIYGVSTECNVASALYTIHRLTGEATLVGTTTAAPCLIDVAINAQGEMYAVDISSDALFRIDPATGAATAIGLLGVNANNAQSLDFEEDTGTLYWAAAVNQAGELRYIDTTTGHSLRIGYFPGYTGVDCFAFATGGGGPFWGDVPWVSEVPTAGVTTADSAMAVDVIFDTSVLTVGQCYTASLGLLHDDPQHEHPAMVPLSLCVESPWPVFYLTKTVAAGDLLPGAPATYTLIYGNDGSLETGITISDALPAGVAYGWSEPAGAYDPVVHEVVWSGLVLDAGARLTATIGVNLDEDLAPGTWLTNTAYLLWRDEALSDWARLRVGGAGLHVYLPLVVKGYNGE